MLKCNAPHGPRGFFGTLAQWALVALVVGGLAATPLRPALAQGGAFGAGKLAPPPLEGEWLNTSGPLTLQDLKGKFVILDFWTYCCINCMHILPELKKLEHKYPNNVVVIGVHSAKFEAERDVENVRAAILRYDIEHPVVNDPKGVLWNAYQIDTWPTLQVIDPEGNLIAGQSGEVKFEKLDDAIQRALPKYRAKGVLNEEPLQFNQEKFRTRATSPLLFPGKVLADAASDRLFVADSNHNRIVVSTLSGKLLDVIGSGAIGKADGGYGQASFNKPQGMALVGETLYVCDTENHMLRKVDLSAKTVTTIAGTGEQRGLDPADRPLTGRVRPKGTMLNSPWDLWVHKGMLYIAMAGPHQIWSMDLAEKSIGVYAGNAREDIIDGKSLASASFAQPSGLTGDDEWLYVADSEGSSVRAVPFNPAKMVKTVVGTADLKQGRLFAFGDVDGVNGQARLQHCLGVAYRDGKIYVSDTYNNKIKVIDVKTQTLTTLAGDKQSGLQDEPALFDEPAGISLAGDDLYIADTNNHAIRVLNIKDKTTRTLTVGGLQAPAPVEIESPALAATAPKGIEVPETKVKATNGRIALNVSLKLPDGFKMNPIAPLRYKVEATANGESLKADGLGASTTIDVKSPDFTIPLATASSAGAATVRVTVTFYYCKEGAEGLCKADRAVWNVPLVWSADAAAPGVDLTYQAK